MKKHIFAYALAALLALGLTQVLVKSGAPTGSLSGEVTDPTGAVVPGAKILVFGDHRTETFSTDETGKFLVNGLKPGRYEVSVSSNGFAPFDRAGLVVTAGHRAKVDASLDLAIVKQAITVTADASSATLAPQRSYFRAYLRWAVKNRQAQRLASVTGKHSGNPGELA